MKTFSIEDISVELFVSVATVRNWLKLGKIQAQYYTKGQPFFTEEYKDFLLQKLDDNSNGMLKSRRNKNYVSGNFLYKDYLSENSENIVSVETLIKILELENVYMDEITICCLIAECAIQLIVQRLNLQTDITYNFLHSYINGELNLGNYDFLINFLIKDVIAVKNLITSIPKIFEIKYKYKQQEDVLGLIYLSCSNLGKRKQNGMYYTPTKVVKTAISSLIKYNNIMPNDKILDGCCGTGNFLINLPETILLEQIYGNDIDDISCNITKINLALKYSLKELNLLNSHITNKNFLTDYNLTDFSYIIGNPPWGYCFSPVEKAALAENYRLANKNHYESFDLFIEKSLSVLNKNGVLSFVLPESILNVKSHLEIRKVIKEKNSIQYLNYLGNIFSGVHCPSIIMQIKHTDMPMKLLGTVVSTVDNVFIINSDRDVDVENFCFRISDKEYDILQKILNVQNKQYLKNNADFALGIVTGDNKKYLSLIKKENSEVILKGSDIEQYRIKSESTYIEYEQNIFQQSAPIDLYRKDEKLVYKFIGNKLIFAYDNQKRLTLNSCNVLIPHIKNMDIKYILAILNSSCAGFLYRRLFNSIKVLKSHIEKIPIPECDEVIQQKIIDITDKLIRETNPQTRQELYNKSDRIISNLYQLSLEEYEYIKNSL